MTASTHRRRWELPRRWRRLLLVLLGVVIVGGLFLSFREPPAEVDLVVAGSGLVEEVLRAEGRARFRDRAELRAPTAGLLERPGVRPGDAVVEGAPILRLHRLAPTPLDGRARARLEAERDAARARVEAAGAGVEAMEAGVVEARLELRRQERLREDGAGTRSAVEVAQAFLHTREALLAEARAVRAGAEAELAGVEASLARVGVELEQVAFTSSGIAESQPGGRDRAATDGPLPLPSPLTGRVLRVHRQSGGPVAPGELLAEVGRTEGSQFLEVVVSVPTAMAPRIGPGTAVRLQGLGSSVTGGTVRLVEPSGFSRVSPLGMEEQRVNVLIDPDPLPDSLREATHTAGEPTSRYVPQDPSHRFGLPGGQIGHDFRMEATFVLHREDVPVRVPVGAVLPRAGSWVAYRTRRARLEEVGVSVGRRGLDWVEVTAGLEVGDRIVHFPGERVADGARFRSRPGASSSPFATPSDPHREGR